VFINKLGLYAVLLWLLRILPKIYILKVEGPFTTLCFFNDFTLFLKVYLKADISRILFCFYNRRYAIQTHVDGSVQHNSSNLMI
jgi:hypothetical protein